MEIAPLLNIGRGLTAIIGSGGKTTLLYTLAEELGKKGEVIICTSTHIRIPEQYPLITGGEEEIRIALEENNIVCAGVKAENNKLTSPAVSFDKLEKMADYVLIEADGSKELPLKAHADYEPVIPENTGRVVMVIGADGLGGAVSEVCHRPEIWTKITGTGSNDRVTSDDVAKVVGSEGLGDCILINKADSDLRREQAESLAEKLTLPVVIGSLKKGEYRKWQ